MVTGSGFFYRYLHIDSKPAFLQTVDGANTCTCGSYFWLNCQQLYLGTILPVYKLRINMNHQTKLHSD